MNSKVLTPKEEQIMNVFWKEGALFVKELIPYLGEPKPHFNTVSTVVRGLEEKGFLAHESFGKTYRYYTIISANEFHKHTLKGVIKKYFNNSYLNVVSSLVKEENISIDDLKQLIDEVEQHHQTKTT